MIGVDLVGDRLARCEALGVATIDIADGTDDLLEAVHSLTDGRGPDAVIDAVGMEAHGSPAGKAAHTLAGMLPDPVQKKFMQAAGVDRLAALYSAIELVRRGGTVSIVGVYGGAMDPMPMLTMFDKQIQLRMGQANVKNWVEQILPLVIDDADPLGAETFATHHLPLEQAPDAYSMFQTKDDGAVKVLFNP